MATDIHDLEQQLWDAADELRANSKLRTHQYSVPVLGLIFLKYADVRFQRAKENLEEDLDPRRDISKADYKAEGVIFLPDEARFSLLLELPEDVNLGKKINEAMEAIERENPELEDVLPKNYHELGNDVLVELLKNFNSIPMDIEGDAFGKIYEYFLGKFADEEGQRAGEFFTPTSIVRLIADVLEPYHGRIYDPACGSGGMFVQSARFVQEHASGTPNSDSSPKGRREGSNYRGGYDFSGLVEEAREFRQEQTEAEELMWELLRNRQFMDKKFRRQHQIGDYIVDFYCHEENLVLEIDGPVHEEDEQKQKDQKRDKYLESQGNNVLRIRNETVLESTEEALEKIEEAISSSPAGRRDRDEGQGPGAPSENISLFGQEKTAQTVRLCKMNLAVHGLEGDIIQGNSYYNDSHDSLEKFDYVMANPPFNVDKVDKEKLKDDPRFPFGMPSVDNGNYVWIQMFYSALNENGRAGFVMANSAADARHSEKEIRKQLIQENVVDVMIAIGSDFFYNVSLPCTLWFIDRGKKDLPPVTPNSSSSPSGGREENDGNYRGGYEFSGLVDKARELRKDQTEAEEIMWELLRDKRFMERKFRRQHQMGDYIVDFYCHEEDLVVEIDGEIHEDEEQKEHDEKRDKYLESQGNTVIRIDNETVLESTEEALQKIQEAIESPSPSGRRDRDEGNGVRGRNTVLFIDARDIYHQIDRAQREFHPHQIEFIANIARLYRGEDPEFLKDGTDEMFYEHFDEEEYEDIPGLCGVATLEEIEEQDWSLNPGRYVGVEEQDDGDIDFEARLNELNDEFQELADEAHQLEKEITENIQGFLS